MSTCYSTLLKFWYKWGQILNVALPIFVPAGRAKTLPATPAPPSQHGRRA